MPTYQSYIHSTAWQAVRARILARAKGKCEKCRVRAPKQVHHKTYARLFNERDDDLIALCVFCHQEEHPDKIVLYPSFIGQHDCPMCPSETAEIFLGKRERLFLCTECGHTSSAPRRHFKAKRK